MPPAPAIASEDKALLVLGTGGGACGCYLMYVVLKCIIGSLVCGGIIGVCIALPFAVVALIAFLLSIVWLLLCEALAWVGVPGVASLELASAGEVADTILLWGFKLARSFPGASYIFAEDGTLAGIFAEDGASAGEVEEAEATESSGAKPANEFAEDGASAGKIGEKEEATEGLEAKAANAAEVEDFSEAEIQSFAEQRGVSLQRCHDVRRLLTFPAASSRTLADPAEPCSCVGFATQAVEDSQPGQAQGAKTGSEASEENVAQQASSAQKGEELAASKKNEVAASEKGIQKNVHCTSSSTLCAKSETTCSMCAAVIGDCYKNDVKNTAKEALGKKPDDDNSYCQQLMNETQHLADIFIGNFTEALQEVFEERVGEWGHECGEWLGGRISNLTDDAVHHVVGNSAVGNLHSVTKPQSKTKSVSAFILDQLWLIPTFYVMFLFRKRFPLLANPELIVIHAGRALAERRQETSSYAPVTQVVQQVMV